MFNNLGTGEILIIGIVVMILFGTKRLPEFTKSLAESAKEFRKGIKDEPEVTKKSTLKKAKPEEKITSTSDPEDNK
jgi:sec-independent protein translocase protein TatA